MHILTSLSYKATHEIINRYSKLHENPQLFAAVIESIDKLREKDVFFRQLDSHNINLSSSIGKIIML
jgi:hypothetical protein